MAARMDYSKAKRRQRLRAAARGRPDETREIHPRHDVSLRGWRLTDGVDHPVTVRTINQEGTHDEVA